MGLEIVKTVRNALDAGEQPKADDVRFLCATADQLWAQIVNAQRTRAAGEARREYMCQFMRRYRADVKSGARMPKRRIACGQSPATQATNGSGEPH